MTEEAPKSTSNRPPAPARRKSGKWYRMLLAFLRTPGGVGLITVGLGGAAGQLITSEVQRGAEERQFQQAWLSTRGEQALSAHKQYVEAGIALVARSYAQIGSIITATDNLMLLTRPAWDLSSRRGADSLVLAEQRRSVRRRYNDEAATWDTTKRALGLMLDYYFGSDDEDVSRAWSRSQRGIDGYAHGAATSYGRYLLRQPFEPDSIDSLRTVALASIDSLSVCIRQKRRFLWEGWEQPESLRVRLHMAGRK